jgi:SAM-dependent methyltransferase
LTYALRVDREEVLAEAASWSDNDLEQVERCPACESTGAAGFLTGAPDPTQPATRKWAYDKCRACGSLFLNPRPTEATIHRAYTGRYYTHADPPVDDAWPATRGAALRERLLKGYINRRFGYRMRPASALGSLVVPLLPGARGMGSMHVRHLTASPRGRRLLDIGCGNGKFLVRMRAAGWIVAGIEPDPDARGHAVGAGLDVRPGPSVAAAFPGQWFDAITLNHVLEHLHHPLDVLASCADALVPDGTLWVAVPSGAAAGLARYGAHWYALDPPRHIVHFTPDALRAAFARVGFPAASSPPATLLASQLNYRASRAFERGVEDTVTAGFSSASDLVAAVIADARTLAQPGHGEELVLRAHARR